MIIFSFFKVFQVSADFFCMNNDIDLISQKRCTCLFLNSIKIFSVYASAIQL